MDSFKYILKIIRTLNIGYHKTSKLVSERIYSYKVGKSICKHTESAINLIQTVSDCVIQSNIHSRLHNDKAEKCLFLKYGVKR